MPTGSSARLPTLTEYGARLRRDAVLVLVAVLVGISIGSLVVIRSPRVFTATASVLLEPVPTTVPLAGDEVQARSVTIDTQAQLVLSDNVVGAVVSATDLTAAEARSALHVSALPLSEVLRVSATTEDPTLSQVSAQAASEAVLQQRAELSLEARAGADALRDRLANIRLQTTDRNQPSGYALQSRLYRQSSYLREQDQTGVDPGQIISPAVTPTRPAGSSPEVPLAGGGMGGFLIGILLGELRARRGSRRDGVLLPAT